MTQNTKMYELNQVPRPKSARQSGNVEVDVNGNGSPYKQHVAVPRKDNPNDIQAAAAIPAAASESMRIKLPKAPLTAEEYYARAGSYVKGGQSNSNIDVAANSGARKEGVGMKAKIQAPVEAGKNSRESNGTYRQRTAVPRKQGEDLPPSNTKNATPSMVDNISNSSKDSEKTSPGESSQFMSSERATGSTGITDKTKFPSLESRYSPQSTEENKTTKSIDEQGAHAALAQDAINHVSEVASEVTSGLSGSRQIHIHVNAPIEIHVYQQKTSKL